MRRDFFFAVVQIISASGTTHKILPENQREIMSFIFKFLFCILKLDFTS